MTMTTMPDDGWIGAAPDQDDPSTDGGFEAQVRPHLELMRAVCHRICGDPHLADEALQLALIAAWRGLPGFDRRARLSTWLYRVAYNASLGVLRSSTRHPTVALDPTELVRPGASDLAQRVTDVEAVRWALTRLPFEFRSAVVLRDLCGCSYREVADIQEVKPETAKTRIARGRQALAVLLGPDHRSSIAKAQR